MDVQSLCRISPLCIALCACKWALFGSFLRSTGFCRVLGQVKLPARRQYLAKTIYTVMICERNYCRMLEMPRLDVRSETLQRDIGPPVHTWVKFHSNHIVSALCASKRRITENICNNTRYQTYRWVLWFGRCLISLDPRARPHQIAQSLQFECKMFECVKRSSVSWTARKTFDAIWISLHYKLTRFAFRRECTRPLLGNVN